MKTPRTNNSINLEKAKNLLNSINHELEDGMADDWVEFKPDEQFWRDITSQYSNAKVAYDTFMGERNAHLFIIVVSKKAELELYYIKKENSNPVSFTTIIKTGTIIHGITPHLNELREKIIHQKENDVKDLGIRFYDYLLRGYLFSIEMPELKKSVGNEVISCSNELKKTFRTEGFLLSEKCAIKPKSKEDEWVLTDKKSTYSIKKEGENLNVYLTSKKILPNQCESGCGVWIYCDDELIKPLWEWIYTEEKFWGDEFAIVRIPEGCDMSDCRVHNEINILANNSTGDLLTYAGDLEKGLNTAGVSECRVIPPSNNELDISSDCIIYATGVDANKMYKDKLDDFFYDRKEVLFWNLYPSRPLRLEQLPATWLDTRFDDLDIPKEFALCFVKLFFEVLNELLEEVKGANEGREVTVAEILRKTRESLISNQKGSQFNNLWRLAYIVNGNPCTRLTVRH